MTDTSGSRSEIPERLGRRMQEILSAMQVVYGVPTALIEEMKKVDAEFQEWRTSALTRSEIERSGWIPVSERRPQRGSTVLVWWNHALFPKNACAAVADVADLNNDERGFFTGGQFWVWDSASHWMPLPEAPK